MFTSIKNSLQPMCFPMEHVWPRFQFMESLTLAGACQSLTCSPDNRSISPSCELDTPLNKFFRCTTTQLDGTMASRDFAAPV